MAERKETPDILSEILANKPADAPGMPSPARKKQREAQAEEGKKPDAQPKASRASSKPAGRVPGWEYRLASFQEYHGWRLRYEDGEEVAEWMEGPLLHEYLADMAEQGWELAAATSGEAMFGTTDKQQLYFKRPQD
jgi:hypothetical protein